MSSLTSQQSAINSRIEKLVEEKYFNILEFQQRGMAFVDLCATLLSENDDMGDEDMVDGSDDNGIDAVSINEEGDEKFVSVFSCKSSHKDGFSENDLKEFSNGIRYLFEEKRENYKKIINKKLLKKIEDVREEKEKIYRIDCYYCVFGGNKNNIDEKVERERDRIKDYYEKFLKIEYPNAIFSIELIDAEDIFNKCIETNRALRNEEIRLPYFGDRVVSCEVEEDLAKGRAVTIKGEEIAKLVIEYGKSLFDKNVRGWMTFRKSNKDILESCTDDNLSQIFWFLNNGINIVCDKCIPDADKKILKIKNLQIINGQQTCVVLKHAFEKKALKSSTKVLVRIYESIDAKFILNVAKSTNSQMTVRSRDLFSNDSLQISIQEEFYRRGYFYERQRGEKRPTTDSVKAIFKNIDVAQCVLSALLKKPCLAKKKKEETLFGSDYEIIFKKDIREIVAVSLLFYECDKIAKKNREKEDRKAAIRYFCALHITRIIWELLDKKDLEHLIESIEKKSIPNFNQLYDDAVNILEEILNEEGETKDIVSIGHFFARIEIDEKISRKIFN